MMYSTRIAPEDFKATTKETIARVQATRIATERVFYVATAAIALAIAVGVGLTRAAL